MYWEYNNTLVEELPLNAFGFIYEITYTDDTKYIGKKQCVKEVRLPALLSGVQRPNSRRTYKNKNGSRVYFDMVKKETNWKKYEGSSEESIGKTIKQKVILEWAPTKRSLTYLEVKFLFNKNVLEDNTYINKNILNSFFKDKLL